MIVFWILLALLLFISFVLFLRIHLIFDFHEKPKVAIRVLCFRIDGNELISKFLSQDDKNGKNAKAKKKNAPEKSKSSRGSGDLLGFVDFLLHVASVLGGTLKDYFSNTKVHLKELHISIGTDDAARTALLCSSAVQAANGLCAVLQHYSKFTCDNKNLSISPDFLSDKSKFSLRLVLSSTVIHLIGVYLRANMRFFN